MANLMLALCCSVKIHPVDISSLWWLMLTSLITCTPHNGGTPFGNRESRIVKHFWGVSVGLSLPPNNFWGFWSIFLILFQSEFLSFPWRFKWFQFGPWCAWLVLLHFPRKSELEALKNLIFSFSFLASLPLVQSLSIQSNMLSFDKMVPSDAWDLHGSSLRAKNSV